MKKQILFLTFFVLATFAGLNDVFGQAVTWSAPRTFSCTDDALHPIAGKQYTYTAVGTPVGGEWRFWATKDPNFITDNAGTPVFNTGTALTVTDGELIYASADYNIDVTVNDGTENTDGTIELTWSSTILAGTTYQGDGVDPNGTPTFVVAYYVDAEGCTDNIKVWELDPLNGFVVDIIPMNPVDFTVKDGYDLTPETCVDVVESATYAAGAMVYDYGDNYLYYEFVAANFTDYWVPTFAYDLVTNPLGPTQAITSYEYTYTTPDLWNGTETWTVLESGTTQIAPDATVTDIGLGVSIFVRVLIDHNQYENLAGQTLTMVLDGQNADGTWDVRNEDCSLPDPLVADGADTANQTITPRPSVTEGTTSTIAPNIELIPGNEQN